MADVLKEFENNIESFTLIPSSGGVFEVTVDGKLIYSKASLGRHAEPGEILLLITNYLKDIQ